MRDHGSSTTTAYYYILMAKTVIKANLVSFHDSRTAVMEFS